MSLLGGAARGALLATTSVLALASLTLVAPAGADPAVSVSSADCPTAYAGSLTAGQTVHGLTVASGTTPDGFTGTVIGVMKQGIDLDTDMIVMKLDSPAIEDAGGIWEGMSGSPVYDDATGQLIGAVSYGLASGASPIAGITPYAAMQRLLPSAAPASVPVSGRLAARIGAAAHVAPADADRLEPLAIPMSISGVSAARVRRAAAEGVPVHTDLATGRIGNAADATGGTDDLAPASTLVAGGNLAAMMVYGDVAEGGIGTVTAVCDGGIVGFGHPLNDTGDAKVALMSADAVYVQPDPSAPFKVANLGVVAGTIAQDRTAGIAGTLGTGPAAASFTSTATYRGRTRTGTSYAADPDFWSDAAFYQAMSNGDAVAQATIPGGATTSYTITGTDAKGVPFTVQHSDHVVSGSDIAGDAAWPLGDLLSGIAGIDGVRLGSVTTTASYDDQRKPLRITGLQQRIGSTWVTVGKKRPVRVRPGHSVRLQVVATAADAAPTYVPTKLTAPRGSHGGGSVALVGGNTLDAMSDLMPPAFHDVATLQRYVAKLVGHDQVRVTTLVGAGKPRQVVLGPLDRVVAGRLSVPVVVG